MMMFTTFQKWNASNDGNGTMLKHLNVTPIPGGDARRTLPNGYLPGCTVLNSSHVSSAQSASAADGRTLIDVSKSTNVSHVSGDPTKITRDGCCSPVAGPKLPPAGKPSSASRSLVPLLAVLCVVSLLMSVLALLFLLEMGSRSGKDASSTSRSKVVSADEFEAVAEVTLGLAAITLSLDMCCLLLCSVQFVFAARLLPLQESNQRITEYLKNSACGRLFAMGSFFVSIPLFLTGIILYIFLHIDSTPAVITSGLIGCGIIFCGCAMVHNVYLWQKVKLAMLPMPRFSNAHLNKSNIQTVSGNVHSGLPSPTLDLSTLAPQGHLELSTLV